MTSLLCLMHFWMYRTKPYSCDSILLLFVSVFFLISSYPIKGMMKEERKTKPPNMGEKRSVIRAKITRGDVLTIRPEAKCSAVSVLPDETRASSIEDFSADGSLITCDKESVSLSKRVGLLCQYAFFVTFPEAFSYLYNGTFNREEMTKKRPVQKRTLDKIYIAMSMSSLLS